MRDLLIVIASALLLSLLYQAMVSFYFWQIKNKLKGQPFKVFIKRLGVKYKYKELSNGSVRYKWKKGWTIIRAEFDDTWEYV